MYVNYNANPMGTRISDCTVRAISKLTGQPWESVYMDLCLEGLIMKDMPSANVVWGSYLRRNGYRRFALPDTCPDCYTVAEFANDHPEGRYLLALNGHVVCVESGNWMDTWDSGSEVVYYYWTKEE